MPKTIKAVSARATTNARNTAALAEVVKACEALTQAAELLDHMVYLRRRAVSVRQIEARKLMEMAEALMGSLDRGEAFPRFS